MDRAEPRWNLAARRILPATIMLATMLMLDSALLLGQGNILMAKDAAADGINKAAARAGPMPPARDPEVAVQEEYQAAVHRGTAEALQLFIARHPDSTLAEKARADLRQLTR